MSPRQLRNIKRVHAISTHTVRPAAYGWRKSFCGVQAYCRENPDRPGFYADAYSDVPFVSWRKPEHVTCKRCIQGMRK